MVERNDPARAGVKAGRVVGVLTAALAAVSLVEAQGSFYEGMTTLLGLFGIGWLPVSALFWWKVLLTMIVRYTIGYVVGSLLGVVDGSLAAVDTRSLLIGGAYLLVWLCYAPAFLWLYDPDAGDGRSRPRRLGGS